VEAEREFASSFDARHRYPATEENEKYPHLELSRTGRVFPRQGIRPP